MADMPKLGPMEGEATLNPSYNDMVGSDTRPLGPGEFVSNPDGSWSNEITTTTDDNSVIPTLWLKDGKPHRVSEDVAEELAKASGLKFPQFNTQQEAEDFANQRESNWQHVRPEDNASVGSLWTPTGEAPAFDDAATAARLQGYSWDQINNHADQATNTALAHGYSQAEVDAHLGFQDPAPFKAGLATTVSQDQTQPMPDPPRLETGLPDLSKPAEVPEGVPQSYADALNAGHVTGPEDFASAYAEATGSTPEAGQALAAQLPHPEDLIDHSIALSAANGTGLDLDTLGTARRNLLDLWAQTGVTPQEVMADKDPVLWDELTKPRDPGLPTVQEMAEIEKGQLLGETAIASGLWDWIKSLKFPDELQKKEDERQAELAKKMDENRAAGKPVLAEAAEMLTPHPESIQWVLANSMGGEGVGSMRTLLEHASENAGKIANDVSVTIDGKTGKGATIEEAHAEATKEPEAPPKLVVAAREPDTGKIFTGKPGQIHADLVPDTAAAEMGFADEHGNFLTRKEALDKLTPQVQADLHVKDELDAADYVLRGPGGRESTLTEAPKADLNAPAEGASIKINGKEYAPKEGETLGDFYLRAQQENAEKSIGEAVAGLSKARVDPVIDVIQPPQLKPEVAPLVRRVDDELNRLRTNAMVDKERLWQAVKQLPEEWLNSAFQEKVSKSVEQRLVDPAHVHDEDVQNFLTRVKTITDRQEELAKLIKGKTEGLTLDEIEGIKSVDEGYVRRVVKDQEGHMVSPLDPEFNRDPITGGQPRSLSKKADSVNQNRVFTMWHADGAPGEPPARTWNADKEVKLGDKQTNPIDGKEYTLKPATMQEVEANTGIRYHQNFIANTVDNVAKLERVNRNLDFLNSTAKELEDAGLLQRDVPNKVQDIPSNFKRVDLPQLRGYANAKIADVLNDFWGGNKSDLQKWTEQASRFIMNSLFISPAAHIGNVGAHWFIGRGIDWANPMGYYRLVRTMGQAIYHVATKSEKYLQLLEHGSGLQFLGTQSEVNNFYSTMMSKLFHEQVGDAKTWGSYAKTLGFSRDNKAGFVGSLVKTELKWSRQALWFMNDVFLMQRVLELQEKGHGLGRAVLGAKLGGGQQMDIREAIYRAEKDIPNYRVPSAVMGSHVLSQVLQSPASMNFGRYRYGQIRAMAMNVRDLVGPGVSAGDRLDALAKLSLLYGVSQYVYPAIDSFIQQQFGDKNWHMKGFGPFSLINAVKGLYAGEKEWGAAMSSFFTWGKIYDVADMVKSNKDFFGRPIINDKKSWLGKLVSGGEAAASQFYPTQLLMQMMKPGGVAKSLGALTGLDYKKPYVEPAWKAKMEQAMAAKWEKNDPIESWIRANLGSYLQEAGITLPNIPAGGGGGGGGSTGSASRNAAQGIVGPSSGRAAAPYRLPFGQSRTQSVDSQGIVGGGGGGSTGGGRSYTPYARGRYYRGGSRRRR